MAKNVRKKKKIQRSLQEKIPRTTITVTPAPATTPINPELGKYQAFKYSIQFLLIYMTTGKMPYSRGRKRVCRNKNCSEIATRRYMCTTHYNIWYRKKYAGAIKSQKQIYNAKDENKKRLSKWNEQNYKRRKIEEPAKMRAEKEKNKRKVRSETLFAYSNGKCLCACCGKDCKKAWDLDHLDDTGSKVRKSEPKGTPYYNRLHKQGFPHKENIVAKCCNCNQARKYGGHKKSHHKLKSYPIDRSHLDRSFTKPQVREFRYKLECMLAYCKHTSTEFRKLFEELEQEMTARKGLRFEAWLKTKAGKYAIESLHNGRLCCEKCGKSWFDFLTLNHTEGGGGKKRSTGEEPMGKTVFCWLRSKNFPKIPGRNVLCYDCQRIDKNKRARSSVKKRK